jgi:hypothetical protein
MSFSVPVKPVLCGKNKHYEQGACDSGAASHRQQKDIFAINQGPAHWLAAGRPASSGALVLRTGEPKHDLTRPKLFTRLKSLTDIVVVCRLGARMIRVPAKGIFWTPSGND